MEGWKGVQGVVSHRDVLFYHHEVTRGVAWHGIYRRHSFYLTRQFTFTLFLSGSAASPALRHIAWIWIPVFMTYARQTYGGQ